ncbi:ribonuclease H-like domain-containing protein [Tanacetum coccineum]
MYSVDLKNVAPSGGLTCLFAKATLEESNLWHRSLGHINFKTMNKLVKGNLVRGLPSKNFENDHTCVACQKGKQHKASCRKHALSFMRPFGCPVTILNTLDHLGKFDGKADEGFFVGYSMNIKAFRVFNSRTRIVEETLHITFLKNKSNVARSGPEWLFDIDTLTKSMNYEPAVIGNQSNGIAGTKACENAGKARVETVPGKDYIMLPFLTQDLPFSSSSKDSPDARFKPSGEEEKKDVEHLENKDSEVPNTEEPRVNQEKDESVNSTNNINIVSSTVNTASIEDNAIDKNTVYGCADDLNMPNLEEIVYSEDDEGVGAEADMNNLDTYMPISPIPTTNIHKGTIHIETNIVWDHGDLTIGKRASGTNWVYRTEKDERGIKSRNKASPLFVVPDGCKDAFYDIIFGSTKKSLCTEFEKLMHKKFQMRSMGELTFFLGLQMTQKDDGIFISQDKYVDEILKKFGFSTMKTASPPIQTLKPLMKDENAKDVDVHLYRSMIGLVMYLTSSRPDIMFVIDDWNGLEMLRMKLGLKLVTQKVNSAGHYLVLLGEKLVLPGEKLVTVGVTTAEENADFDEIVDFLNANPIRYALTFLQLFLNNQIENLTPTFNDEYDTPSHTKKVFANMRRQGKDFSGTMTPLFATMLIQPQADVGEGSGQPTKPQHTPTTASPSNIEPSLNMGFHYHNPKRLKECRKPKGPTEISQSSGPTTLVADETVHEEREDSMEKAATTAISLDVEQGSGLEITSLKKRVKKLEKKKKARTPQLKRRLFKVKIESSADKSLGDQEDASKQGRNIAESDQDEEISFVQEDAEIQGRYDQDINVTTVSAPITTAGVSVSTAEPSTPLTTTTVIEDEDLTIAQTLMKMRKELEAKLEEEERVTIQREEEANLISWDNTQPMIEADYELAQRLQAEEQGELTIEERSKLFVELMKKRKKHFAKLRAEKIRRKPPTKSQKRNQMSTYLRNMAGYKHTQLKNKSFEEIQMLFDKEMKRVNSFVPIDSEVVKSVK